MRKLSESAELHPIAPDYQIYELESFKKEARKMKLIPGDIEELKRALKERAPEAALGSGLYKFRWSPSRSNLGSKEDRVIYAEVTIQKIAYLLSIYPKNRKKDLSINELKALRKGVKEIKQ